MRTAPGNRIKIRGSIILYSLFYKLLYMFGMWSGIFPDRGNVVRIYTGPGVIIMLFVKKSADRPGETARMSYGISDGRSFYV